MNSFTLTNDGAPAFQKENPEAFKPMTASQKARQAIYSLCQSNPELEFRLPDVARKLKIPYRIAREACRTLVRKGMLGKGESKEPSPTKKNPDRVVTRITVCFIAPWGKKVYFEW